jgi:hypothetical protein
MATTDEQKTSNKALVGLVLGRVVRYVRPEDGEHRAALVVDTGDGTGQDAVLLLLGTPREGLSYVPASAFDSETKAAGTWHWNERG